MFYAAKAMLLAQGLKATKHKHVIRRFNDVFVLPGKVEATHLEMLEKGFLLRHSADYESGLTRRISSEEARSSLERATDFVRFATAFLEQGAST